MKIVGVTGLGGLWVEVETFHLIFIYHFLFYLPLLIFISIKSHSWTDIDIGLLYVFLPH